ncbi:ATP-binding protein [Nonomuraea mangrovi]|uniref:ATP-binding protein n=1 Tax=Nonomuraea mangrovi TaxID=2316207 RepID=A0ABW4T537_9ACTN
MNVVTSTSSRRREVPRLPIEVTSFVGRRHEVAEVRRLLTTGRVVTLTGVGGVGKTRLALRVAADVRRAFPDGVWLVELAGLENPDLLVRSLIDALEIGDRSSRPAIEVLVDHLRDKQALVVLDNCEHLVDDCAVLAQTLVRSASELRILATSRQVLGFTGERTLAVPPLSLPDAGMARPSAGASGEAVRLFAERAGDVLPGFAVTDANREAVERICLHLDGIPLGIELAAVRLRALSVEQLLARLDNRFQLLATRSQAVVPRQQTLRGLIDWSYGLCTEQERLLWARASVFACGLDLEAAEEVCSGDGIDRDEIMDLVSGLVDKSVLARDDHLSSLPAARYRLLETIRQYGREQLAASGQEPELRRRHRDYFREKATQLRAHVFGPGQAEWFGRLRPEHANLRLALEYCFAVPDEVETGLGMATDLFHYWITGTYLGEGCHWINQGLAAVTGPSELRARALWANSWLRIIQTDIRAAGEMLREARALGERLGHEPALAYVALCSGMIAMYRGNTESAVALYEQAMARHRGTGDPMGLALALVWLCLACSLLGDSPRAIAAGEDCLAVCDAHGERWVRTYALMALAVETWRQGDGRRAAALAKESLRFQHSIDDLLGVRFNLEVLIWIAAGEGRFQRAAELLGVLQTIRRRIDVMPLEYVHVLRHYDESESRTREALGGAAFGAAVRRGAGLSYEEALDYVLAEDAVAGRPPAQDAPPSPLTPREMEIARLIAQGMSNKEIAASLVIAQRTAEGHVEHILTKLGFNSRTQIAVWIGELDRPPDEEHPSGG